MSTLSACAMLNEGLTIVERVRFQSGVIDRKDKHSVKRRAMLRKLSLAQLSLGPPVSIPDHLQSAGAARLDPLPTPRLG